MNYVCKYAGISTHKVKGPITITIGKTILDDVFGPTDFISDSYL